MANKDPMSLESLLGGLDPLSDGDMMFPGETSGGSGNGSILGGSGRVSDNREDKFELDTGQFRGPGGQFEPGGPPPDYEPAANRYRANNGQFKSRSSDLFDEPAEVALDSLEPRG